MKVIIEPKVTLLSVPLFTEHPRYQLPRTRSQELIETGIGTSTLDGTHAEQLIAHAGKGCYDSYGEDGRAIARHINGLIASGHGSVLEHANISVFIEGISRGCSHEIVRHRAGFAFSQRSTRYTAEEDAALVLEPYLARLFGEWYEYVSDGDCYQERVRGHVDIAEVETIDLFLDGFKSELARYRRAIELLTALNPEALSGVELRKWCRGKARQLLPHGLETRMTMTGNLRAWRHFLEQRSHPAAEAEIRRLAFCVWEVIAPVAPFVFRDYDGWNIVNGYPHFTSQQRKV